MRRLALTFRRAGRTVLPSRAWRAASDPDGPGQVWLRRDGGAGATRRPGRVGFPDVAGPGAGLARGAQRVPGTYCFCAAARRVQ